MINKSARCKQDDRFEELLWTDKGERGTENHSFHLKEMGNKMG